MKSHVADDSPSGDVGGEAEGETFVAAFADRWLAAWNSHDTNQVLDLLHEDVIWDDRTFWPDIIHGIDGVREYADRIWEAMPDVQFEEIERFMAPGRRRGVVLFRQYGSGPARLNASAGFDSHGCDIFLEFRDGKLAHYLASYDIVPMLLQMGALPDKGSQLGGAYLVRLAHQAGQGAYS
jgi:predicted ester cyclase